MSSPEELVREDLDTVEFIHRVWALGSGFQCAILLDQGQGGLALLREALGDKGAVIEDHDPGQTFLTRILETVEAPQGEASRDVIWVEQPDFEASAWRKTFAALNINRERLREGLDALLILAGPPALREISRLNGTDLASISTIRYFKGHHARQAGTSFNWLQFSGFHFTADTDLGTEKRWLDLLKTLAGLPRPDLVFFCGDIAAGGLAAEYGKAREFFNDLRATLGHNSYQNWFLVPGSRDVDGSRIGRVDGSILRDIHNSDDLEVTQRDSQAMNLLSRRLQAFYGFTRDLLGPARGWQPENPWRGDVRDLDGLCVGIMQLNTAWAGGLAEDKGRLLLGRHQLSECLDQTAGVDLCLALGHHPLSYLADFDQKQTRAGLHDRGVGLFLSNSGSLESDGRTAKQPALLELPVDLSNQGDRANGFQMVEVDMARGGFQVQRFAWDDQNWRPTPDKLKLAIPSHGLQKKTTADPGAQRRHYRKAVGAFHGVIRFMGLAEDSPNPNTNVEHVFVPLSLKQEESDEVLATTDLARSLVKGGAVRLVVLGDPGSGKSTLCKYLAQVVAGETEIPANGEPLPLVIPFREYVEAAGKQSNLGLVTFLVEQAQTEFSITITPAYLETVLASGRAVLLLDGLDEVGRVGQRALMRDRVQSFCTAWSRVPVLITSRIAGYEDAPMNTDDSQVFRVLKLEPFSDDELNQFVQRWYQVMLPNSPTERNRRTLQLIKGLEQTPSARELARNPLLATLLALVHFYRLELPGERARLYNACVKTLLETWPVRRGKSFTGFDTQLQVRYLSELALEMQDFRTNEEKGGDLTIDSEVANGNVLISRDALHKRLARLLKQRFGDHALELAGLWVQFLELDSGLLVEQSTGYLGFFHLTLLEYLAALGLCDRKLRR